MPEHAVFIGVGSNIDPEDNISRALEQLAMHVPIEAVSTFYRTAPLAKPGNPLTTADIVEQPPSAVDSQARAAVDSQARAAVDSQARAAVDSQARAAVDSQARAPVPQHDDMQQPLFLNGVVKVRTGLDALTLKLDVLRGIESVLGRVRTADAHAARTIDLDILLYDSAIIEEPKLRIPDPDIRERPFLAIPLLELAPDLVLPDTGERLAALPCARRRAELIPADDFSGALRERLGL